MSNAKLTPDYLFEVSWEVCNKIGGIHTVVSTKAQTATRKFGDRTGRNTLFSSLILRIKYS